MLIHSDATQGLLCPEVVFRSSLIAEMTMEMCNCSKYPPKFASSRTAGANFSDSNNIQHAGIVHGKWMILMARYHYSHIHTISHKIRVDRF